VRTFHIGGTASRISEQNTLDARHTGTAHYEAPVVVEAHRADTASGVGQLIVMNRNGSLVVRDEKGRDREQSPIVYGARLQVRDGQKVEQGQALVEWDPYTFSILTDHQGVALHRLVHLGALVPGDDARAHRGVDFRPHRPPARPEGERDDGPADPGGHRVRVLPARADSAGRAGPTSCLPALSSDTRACESAPVVTAPVRG
jgi:hypothetical protein